MTGLYDGLGILIMTSLFLLLYLPIITLLLLKEAQVLQFIARRYRFGAYFVLFLLLIAVTIYLIRLVQAMDGLLIYALLATLIYIVQRIRSKRKPRL